MTRCGRTAGRIGPNAVIRLAEALDAVESKAVTLRLFNAAGLGAYVADAARGHGARGRGHGAPPPAPQRAGPDARRQRLVDRGAPHGGLPAGQPHPEARAAPAEAAAARGLPPSSCSRPSAPMPGPSRAPAASAGRSAAASRSSSRIARSAAATTRQRPAAHYYAATFERLFRELISCRCARPGERLHRHGCNQPAASRVDISEQSRSRSPCQPENLVMPPPPCRCG